MTGEGSIEDVIAGRARWNVTCGDCIEVLSGVSAELSAVVTDPPFSSGARTEAAKQSRNDGMLRGARFAGRPIDCDQMTTAGFVWTIREVALLCEPMLKSGASFLSFIDWRQWSNLVGALESCNLRVNQMIVWDKGSFGMGNGFRNQHELICWSTKGTADPAECDVPNVIQCPRVPPDWHPSPKPVPLMESLLRVACPVGGIVLDPFAGGGSTGVAALRQGKRVIMIERNATHAEHCRDRMRAEETSSTVEALRANQLPMFGGAQ